MMYKEKLIDLGFNEKEIKVIEELSEKLELNCFQVLRQALRLYQAKQSGFEMPSKLKEANDE